MTNPMEMVNGVLQEMSDADYAAFQAMQSQAASEQATRELNQSAISAMIEADKTVSRIIEAVVQGKTTLEASDVVAFMAYRTSLRPLITATSGTLPTKPAYPANT